MVTTANLRIELLGPFRLWRGPAHIDTGSTQQRAVLALLALNAGRVVRLVDLIDAVWPHGSPPSASNVVQTYVKRLRRILEPERRPRQPAEVLLTSGEGYLLRVPEDQVDVFLFRSVLAEARRTVDAGQLEAALACFARAFARWRDVPLSDLAVLSESRLVTELVEEHASALCEYADAAIAAGRAGGVLPMLRRAADGAPTHERLHARLISCHRLVGDRTTAFEVYRRVQRQLRDDFGVDPSPELRTAYLELLADESSTVSDLPPSPAPAQLPPDAGELTGRDRERTILLDALSTPDTAGRMPVWVIAGMCGIGKTTLAVHVAHRLAAAYWDGQLFADLTGARPAEVLAQFLVALGVNRSLVPDGFADRTAMFRSLTAGRRILVVLDNAASEALVRPLLPGSTTCAVLMTSRSRLPGLSNAGVVDLGQLSDAEAVSLLRTVAGRTLDEGDVDAHAVVALCDRMPLAVRIAGARLARRSDITLARFARRLSDEKSRLDLLSTGDVGIRACFDVAYAELGVAARRVFVSFGLLRLNTVASWVLAVSTGLSHAQTELAIDELVDTQLFAALGVDMTGEPRYGVHDLVRLYATEQATIELSGAERRDHLGRVLAAWLALAREADHKLPYRTLPDPAPGVLPELPMPLVSRLLADPLVWFEVERDQLRSLVIQACSAQRPSLAWQLADACAGFYEAREHYDDWRETHLTCLAACPENSIGAFTMTRNLAYQYSLPVIQGPAMAEYAQRAVDISEAVGLTDGAAQARALLAVAAVAQVRFTEAVDLVDKARVGVLPGSLADLATLGVLGFISRLRGDLDDAAAHFVTLLRHVAGHRHNGYELVALRVLAIIRRDQRRYAEATHILADGIALARSIGVRANELLLLIEHGEVSALALQPGAAADLTHATRLAESISSEIGAALAWRAMSTVDILRGDLDTARERLIRSLAVQQRHGVPYIEARTLRTLGDVYAKLGDPTAAGESWLRARAIYTRLGNHIERTAIDHDLRKLVPDGVK